MCAQISGWCMNRLAIPIANLPLRGLIQTSKNPLRLKVSRHYSNVSGDRWSSCITNVWASWYRIVTLTKWSENF